MKQHLRVKIVMLAGPAWNGIGFDTHLLFQLFIMIYKSELVIEKIFQLRLAMKQHLQRKLKEENFEITYEMLQVLALLWKREDRNQKEIGIALQKDKASITPILHNLERRSLVTRKPDPGDRRNNMISLTSEGRKIKECFSPVINGFYRKIEQHIAGEAIEQAAETLDKMYENITE